MYFLKSFVVLVAAAALASAALSVSRYAQAAPVDNCNGVIGNCYSNGCAPQFGNSGDTIGSCTAGTYDGCPCEKCGGGVGYIGGCSYNGCNGSQGTCTAGKYDGCPCD